MSEISTRLIAVVGATGLQGGAVARRLRADGPGRRRGSAASRGGAPHLRGCRAGIPGTGIGSWETKVEVASHMRALDLPLTVLRPMAFMELMTERKFFPPASMWHMMPKLMGAARPVGWLAVEDLAAIVAKAFGESAEFIGRDLALTSDVQSNDECRQIWRRATGRAPRRLPMPVRLFERFVGTDETTMWRWLRDNHIDLDTTSTRAIHPTALTVEQWVASPTARP